MKDNYGSEKVRTKQGNGISNRKTAHTRREMKIHREVHREK